MAHLYKDYAVYEKDFPEGLRLRFTNKSFRLVLERHATYSTALWAQKVYVSHLSPEGRHGDRHFKTGDYSPSSYWSFRGQRYVPSSMGSIARIQLFNEG